MAARAVSERVPFDRFAATCLEVRALVSAIAPGVETLSDGDPLFAVHIDSLAFLRVLRTLEQHFAFRVSETDVVLTDFNSIRSIAAYIASRSSGIPDSGAAQSGREGHDVSTCVSEE
jgi:acyl carrier protein